MPRRERPSVIRRSEHWLRVLVNEHVDLIGQCVADAFGWQSVALRWRSPMVDDNYAEYYDQSFLDRLDLADLNLPLEEFWPHSGPRWDGLARTDDGKVLLVEAKAHIEECVDWGSRAQPASLQKIHSRLDEAKRAFRASSTACWRSPLYQMANRLAHLYYLAQINKKDAYLLFIYFANVPDVDQPVSHDEWKGAIRLAHKCLGLGRSALMNRVAEIVVDVDEMIGQ